MMSRSPQQRVVLLLLMSALVLLLGLAVAMTVVNSTTWRMQLLALGGEYPAPMLGLTFDRGLNVIELITDGPADKAGVKLGDVVIAINREPVSDAGRAYQMFQSLESGTSVRLGMRRENNKVDAIVQPMAPPVQTEGAP